MYLVLVLIQVGKILVNALIYHGIKMNIQKNTITSIFHTAVTYHEVTFDFGAVTYYDTSYYYTWSSLLSFTSYWREVAAHASTMSLRFFKKQSLP